MAPPGPKLPRRITWLEAPPPRPLGAREGARHSAPGQKTWDLGPPGLTSVGPTLAALAALACVLAPLGVLGMATLGEADWPLGLRVCLGLLGGVAILGAVLPVLWALLFAASWRERLVVGPAGVHIARGAFTRALRPVGDPGEVTVRAVLRPEGLRAWLAQPNAVGAHDLWRLAIHRSDTQGHPRRIALLGAWLDKDLALRLSAEISACLRAAAAPSSPPGAPLGAGLPPLGWSPATLRAEAGALLRERLGNPAALLFDLGLLVGALLPPAPDADAGRLAFLYPGLALLMYGALYLRVRHGSAVFGLAPAAGAPLSLSFVLALAALALLTGFTSAFVLTPSFGAQGFTPAGVGIALTAAITASILIARRALKTARAVLDGDGLPQPPLVVTAIFTLSLSGLTIIHEGWAWLAVTAPTGGVILLPAVATLLIWPSRVLFSVETPFDEGPRWRFLGLIAVLIAVSLARAGAG